MAYREQSPPSEVSRWVECVWSVETDDQTLAYPVRPDGCVDIVYSDGRLEVVGAMTARRHFHLAPRTCTAGLRFRPGMATPFLRVAAQQLTDRMIPLDAMWGNRARELAARLADSTNAGGKRQVLANAISAPNAAPNGVQRAIERMTKSGGRADFDSLARNSGVSQRQFRRRCLEEAGLTPKLLCRVLRFRRAFALGQCGLPWSLIAIDTGYFDQAHLIRDFREFAGETPLSVFSNTNVAQPA